MVLTYYGFSCFRIQSGDNVIAIDPFSKKEGAIAPRFEARLALFTDPTASTDVSLTGNIEMFSSPGEYDVSDIHCIGFDVGDATPFFIELENISLLHLGTLGDPDRVSHILESTPPIDILFISSGTPTKNAEKIVSSVDPRITIPMQIGKSKKGAEDEFAKQLSEKIERLDKLTLKKKDVSGEGRKTVILSASRS